ncbi:hypothetical protein NDR87_03270 [Nocardia sp. CDC159]|uniref:LamG-like jellyroll fold domain-containing protein n=1 Tax=Nocardia pulmonis TaxID=2951408 RepID=A0A9X2E1P8_9NOCA|nr:MULTISPECIES: LamG-like jellyroll fold domain-containing protein [Nocardia]MCM6771965.1 hypothetical protein [Nocardia pulmonis]MCM6785377.1 hypothetical protein [Nocardia sp. CDC159]
MTAAGFEPDLLAPLYPAAVDRMAGTLTTPFAAGADRLELRYAGGEPTRTAAFEPYDFSEHRARYGTAPRVRYLVRITEDIVEDLTLTVTYSVSGTSKTAGPLAIAAGTPAGASLLFPLGPDAAAAVLTSVAVQGPTREVTPPAQSAFTFTALLGDLAALLWVLGGDRDVLAAHFRRIRQHSTVARAGGLSLDLIGSDLSIPRFPPLPYGFTSDTIALYHLDDGGTDSAVADATRPYTGVGHPGTRGPGVVSGVDGRFGSGMRFDGAAEITVPDHPDFELPAGASLTAECFARPAPGAWTGAVLSKHTDMTDENKPGWGLHIGTFRGIDRNVLLRISDGSAASPIRLYADLSLQVDRFHHLAAVLDRRRKTVALYVNGALRASAPAELGALTNISPLRIGYQGAPGFSGAYLGTVDEVRISRRALSTFAPVLGEDDESYRQRLRVFRRWNLPTPAHITATLNEVVGSINDYGDPLTVSDAFDRAPIGLHALTIRPVILGPGESVDARGRRGRPEAEVCGTVADDRFDPRWLIAYGSPQPVTFAGDRRMRQSVRRALDALIRLLLDEGDIHFPDLRISAYDPAATDLRAVGRAVVLSYPKTRRARVAALAHRAGFSWVRHRAGSNDIYASVADTTSLEIVGPIGEWYGKDTAAQREYPLSLLPEPPRDCELRWSVLQAGPGRAELVGDPAATTITLRALRPGEVTVKIEARLGGTVYSATRRITIGTADVGAGTSIGADGRIGVDESVAGAPDDGAYSPDHLLTVSDPALVVAVPGANRMQASIAARLQRLLAIIAASARVQPHSPNQIRLVSGWTPNGTGLDGVGRAFVLDGGPSGLAPASLAALAQSVGFDYVRNTGTAVRIAHRGDRHIALTGPAEVEEGQVASIATARHDNPVDAVLAGALVCVVNQGNSTVSLLDSTTGALLTYPHPVSGEIRDAIPVGAAPVGIAASADGKLVFTASAADRTITAITVPGRTVAAVGPALPATPLRIVGHPTRPLLVVLAQTQVFVVDIASLAVTKQWAIPASSPGRALALDPSGATAWIACDDKTLRAVNIDTGAWVSAPNLPDVPLAVAASSTTVYVSGSRALWAVDTASRTLTGTYPLFDRYPMRMRVDEATGVLQIGEWDGNRISRVRPQGGSLTSVSTALPGTPVAILPFGGSVLTVLSGDLRSARGDAVATVTGGSAPRVAALWPLTRPGGKRLEWSLRTAGEAAARLDGSTGEVLALTAERAGAVQVRVRAPVARAPYTVRIGLIQPLLDLERTGVKILIRRDQYERIMNVLNELHPIGVEFDTREIRARVPELQTGDLKPFPAYTYPTYRLRGQQLARRIRKD